MNYFNTAFKIKLTRETGWADIKLSVCKNQDQNFENCIGENEKILIEKHVAGESAATIHITPDDPNYCTYCTYFIHVDSEPNEGDFHGHLNVLLDNDVVWLQESRPLMDSLDPDEQIIYRLSVPAK
jgi:hypothetical protein